MKIGDKGLKPQHKEKEACSICGKMVARIGIKNHMATHKMSEADKSKELLEAWKNGYKEGYIDGSKAIPGSVSA